MSTDLSLAIVPKSDQLNADDLIASPLVITITKVSVSPGEQPIAIDYQGGEGRPWKPCKSMARVLVLCWGPDGKSYCGRRVRLYRDPEVRFGPAQVGGIRISHLSHINGARTIALTSARGRRVPYQIEPLPDQSPALAASQAAPALDPDHPRRLNIDPNASQKAVQAAGAALRDAIANASSPGFAITWWELNEDQFRNLSKALADWIEAALPETAEAIEHRRQTT